jgi:ABC-type dipeptide/oligopeptide/nickel transport system ATPase subunit
MLNDFHLFFFLYIIVINKEMEIVNFYSLLPKSKEKKTVGFNNHYIEKNSRIMLIGQSGSGKSNSLLNFIERSSGEFHKIIICSFSTTDEALYTFLKQKIPDVELINKIEDVPKVQDFDDIEKNKPKLIVFDDFINLNKKQMKILEDYAISSRKFGFTTVFISQNYTSVPKIISRNCNYIFVFKINDRISIKRIISNHGLSDHYTPERIEQLYHYCISQPLGFLTIDLKTNDSSKILRCGFTQFL